MKIPLSSLEQVRKNPLAYKASTGVQASGPRFGFSSYRLWQYATRRVHEGNNGLMRAIEYLEDGFGRNFKSTKRNEKRLGELIDKLTGYSEDFDRLGHHIVELGKRVDIWLDTESYLAGEIPRVDLIPSGGYAIYLFEKEESDWQLELRMPILQRWFAHELRCPSSQVSIGVYCFENERHHSRVFTDTEVETAWNEATALAVRLK